MKRNIIYIIILLIPLMACKIQKIEQKVNYGTYRNTAIHKYMPVIYILMLNPDSTCQFIYYSEYKAKCSGKWKIVDNKFILMTRDEYTNPCAALNAGYIGEKELEFEIINKSKIKYGILILKHKKIKEEYLRSLILQPCYDQL